MESDEHQDDDEMKEPMSDGEDVKDVKVGTDLNRTLRITHTHTHV